jgi:hypothetical protein
MSELQLSRNAFGKLVLRAADGQTHENVVPVRAFPIAAPDAGISIVSADGHELAWFEHLNDVPAGIRALLQEELRNREFLPEILRIKGVSTFASPSTWQVETNRGDAVLLLKGEDDIRRIGDAALMISDAHGVQFLIRNLKKLDKTSRKILDRFL